MTWEELPTILRLLCSSYLRSKISAHWMSFNIHVSAWSILGRTLLNHMYSFSKFMDKSIFLTCTLNARNHQYRESYKYSLLCFLYIDTTYKFYNNNGRTRLSLRGVTSHASGFLRVAETWTLGEFNSNPWCSMTFPSLEDNAFMYYNHIQCHSLSSTVHGSSRPSLIWMGL